MDLYFIPPTDSHVHLAIAYALSLIKNQQCTVNAACRAAIHEFPALDEAGNVLVPIENALELPGLRAVVERCVARGLER